ALNGDRSDNHTEKKKKAAKNKQQSHIRQAHQTSTKNAPKAGPMADMLKKLFGKDDD
ncbi:MAG: aminoacyl-tRNA hydrolase, partial [Rhizobiaceae bacterium]|nr:aminoacyl-tRNA hydrolase [Rhizobiaceae bacterium]